MALPYGIDTSILVRLVTREPQADFERSVSRLSALVEDQGYEIFASNQVVGGGVRRLDAPLRHQQRQRPRYIARRADQRLGRSP